MKKDIRLWKIAAILLLVFLVTTSAAQAVMKINTSNNNQNVEPPVISSSFNDEVYTWEDLFNNGQKIDMSESEDYITSNGKVKMDGTYSWWTDPSWTRAKIIELDSSLSGDDSHDVAIKLIIEHDSDMRSDYGDVRFRYNGAWLDYWIEERNQVDAIFWVKVPTLDQGTSYMYMFYGKPSAQDESDYWSVFDENSWQSEHVNDERVTNHMNIEGAWDPDVCFGNNKFLVTWEEGTAYWPQKGTIFKQQIRGCFYNTDGDPTSNRFDIVDEPFPDNPLKPYRYENPNGAYDSSGKYLVAFEHYLNPITNAYNDRAVSYTHLTLPTN